MKLKQKQICSAEDCLKQPFLFDVIPTIIVIIIIITKTKKLKQEKQTNKKQRRDHPRTTKQKPCFKSRKEKQLI